MTYLAGSHILKSWPGIQLIRVALCRISVGGAVARIPLLVVLRSNLLMVSVIVFCMVSPSSMPKCLIVEGVLNP
jgi:hypothetical protein